MHVPNYTTVVVLLYIIREHTAGEHVVWGVGVLDSCIGQPADESCRTSRFIGSGFAALLGTAVAVDIWRALV